MRAESHVGGQPSLRRPTPARPGGGTWPEDVAEDFQGERPLITGAHSGLHQGGEVELALDREAAIVPAPLQDVHGHQRYVGELQEEDLLTGNGLNALGVRYAGENVKAVQTDSRPRYDCPAWRSAPRWDSLCRASPRRTPRTSQDPQATTGSAPLFGAVLCIPPVITGITARETHRDPSEQLGLRPSTLAASATTPRSTSAHLDQR